jgi:TPR repeat protein
MFVIVAAAYAQSPPSNDPAQYYDRGMNALRGTGVSHNTQDALQLLRTSAEMGYLPAQTVVGYFYDTGDIVAREPGIAAEWYRKAAAQDDPLAEWLLGRLYLTGGLQRDLNQAALALQKSAQQQNPFAEYLLGEIRLEQQNYSDAAKSFRDAAQQGLPHAQQELGVLLEKGRACRRTNSKPMSGCSSAWTQETMQRPLIYRFSKETSVARKWKKPRARRAILNPASAARLSLMAAPDGRESST